MRLTKGRMDIALIRQAPELPKRDLSVLVVSSASNPPESRILVLFGFGTGREKRVLLLPGEGIRSNSVEPTEALMEMRLLEQAAPAAAASWWLY